MERWLPGFALFAGFLWIRFNLGRIRDEKRRQRALYTVLLLLVPLLILGRRGVDYLPYSSMVNRSIELAVMAAAFGLINLFLLKPDPGE